MTYQVYGLAFFVLGVVAYMLPKRDGCIRFAPHMNLLAAFGMLHGIAVFVESHGFCNPFVRNAWVGHVLLLASYLSLLEFGRRIWVSIPSSVRLPAAWVHGISGLAVVLLAVWATKPYAGLEAGARFFVGAPSSLLTGLALLASRRSKPECFATGYLPDHLRIVALAFIGYGLLAPFLAQNDPHLPSWMLSQADFLALIGVPIQLLCAVSAVAATMGFVEMARQTGEINRVDATVFGTRDAIVITDANTKILRVNKAFVESTGYKAEEVIGHKLDLLKSGHYDRDWHEALWESVRRTGTWQGEFWDRRKNGKTYPGWLTVTAIKSADGTVTHYVSTHTDITERKAAEDEIKNLAFYDSLTQLPNRRLLLDRLRQALASSARNGNHGALLFIDLDNFKTLNDTRGHDVGDLLLQQVADRLTTCMREEDTVARLGGDEFVVMLEDLNENSREAAIQTETVGEKILATLTQPYQLGIHDCRSSPSIGATLFLAHDRSIEDLLKQADIAMYQAKAAGRNTLRFFDPNVQAAVNQRANMEAELRKGVQERQFVLYYQPQVDEQGRMKGAEVLVRWQHPERGLVFPVEFISLAEETGLILPLGQWVLETACLQLAGWSARTETAHLTLSVNVSACQFQHVDFVENVLKALEYSGADPFKLKLELTETLLLDDVEAVIAKMTKLKEKGVGFSLDDFGVGYSSLSHLKRLPLDQLKIDQGFVRDILVDANDAAIAKMVVALGDSMGLEVIAEGVEEEAQRNFLALQGCHRYQGYLFGRPAPVEAFEEFVKREPTAT